MTLDEMLQYGAIVAQDDELGVYITANKAYLNYWVRTGTDSFQNTDVRSFSDGRLAEFSLGELEELGNAFIAGNDALSQSRIADAKEGN